jgi:hypothetical protein
MLTLAASSSDWDADNRPTEQLVPRPAEQTENRGAVTSVASEAWICTTALLTALVAQTQMA